MNVYIVVHEIPYEGDEILSVWLDEKKAEEEVCRLMEEDKESVENESSDYYYQKWETEDKIF